MKRLHLIVLVVLLIIPRWGSAAQQKRTPPPSQRSAAAEQAEAEKKAQAEANNRFDLGQKAHEQGHLPEAIEHYTAALTLVPELAPALYQRAIAYLSLGKPDEAGRDLSRLVELEPEFMPDPKSADVSVRSFFARVHNGLAELMLNRKEDAKAEEHLKKAIDLDPKWSRPQANLGTLLLQRKAFDEAAARLKAALDGGPPSATLHAMLGYAYEQLKQADAALENYSKAIELDPKDALTREGRGHLLMERKEYARAAADLEVAYQVKSGPQTGIRLAEAYQLSGKTEEAVTLCQKLIVADPKNRPASQLLIRWLVTTEWNDKAVKDARRAEAVKEARRLAEVFPTDPAVLGQLGELLLQNDDEGAAKAYARALELDPQQVVYRVNLSSALIRLHRFADAIQQLNLVLQKDPNNYHAHAGLGTAYYEMKDFVQAVREFNWVVQHKPEVVIAYYFLAICLDNLKQYEQALAVYQTFLQKGDPAKNKAELDNATFRLPSLKRLIEEEKKKRKKRN
jgi:tetratricopeptide (TPR) repeat protein